MPSISKTRGDRNDRSVLNTTIDATVFDNFRTACRKAGVPMNVLLEIFMRQYSDGEFSIKITKNEKKIEFVEE